MANKNRLGNIVKFGQKTIYTTLNTLDYIYQVRAIWRGKVILADNYSYRILPPAIREG